MTEPAPVYQVTATAATEGQASRLPSRAWKFAMRMLELERDCNRRGRVTVDLIMIDGEWLIGIVKPGELERLGE